ncbi:serine/threonine-protein kinase [Kitasatospora viridis]|uniref:non-specific serine/threonine protein kinase n=1 Tax=Kitasatospora viridis TaxID=281105 RepID=A0A561UB90_9ACTN|nr:serine/threonine-protein kinase [Kitasatospora viridis]TWF96621.1 serine/threonine protein kinase [Kitasatospora viridis]
MQGTVLDGRYRLEALLGHGGMGAVWSAHDERLDREVAVKLIRSQLGRADSELGSRFRREARLAAQLLGHPHIVAVLDFGVQQDSGGQGTPFVVMELVRGSSLKDVVTSRSQVSPAQAVEWCAQVCDALAAAHGAGIVHRDIKPDNVLLVKQPVGGSSGIVKVVDFGIAAYLHADRTRITRDGEVVGSAHYMAPERMEPGQAVDPRSDLYSVGCLLYELLTGRPPFEADDTLGVMWAHARSQPEAPSRRREGISAALDELVLGLLAKQPDDRPADAATVRDALRVIEAGGVEDRSAGGGQTEVVRLAADLAADLERALGPDHPDTLAARQDHARYVGEAGDHAEAVRLFASVAADRERVLGPGHLDALNSRDHHAWNVGVGGDRVEAARLFASVAADRERFLGADHPSTLRSRHNHADNVGAAGDRAEAVRLCADVVVDRERVLGADHVDTLISRSLHAWHVGQAGDYAEAARLYARLAADRERVLGPDHPDTLNARSNQARRVSEGGDYAEAARLFARLAADRERVLGPDHPDTLSTRHDHARYVGEAGDRAEGARLFARVVADRERFLGADHPGTLSSRHNHAYSVGGTGDYVEAVRLCAGVVADRERVLGADHVDTLISRNLHASYVGAGGDHVEAARLFARLAADRERVLGPDHPDTLRARRGHLSNLGKATGRV